MKIKPISIFRSSIAFLCFIPFYHYAQTPPVLFNLDGSVVVANNVVHLQTTALLSLAELYRLPPDPDMADGIEMVTDAQFGANARVEVRVFDYDEVNKRRGALIYATVGTQNGWNRNSWNPNSTLFQTSANFSSSVSSLFQMHAIPSTDIKTWSQFEGLGPICADGQLNNQSLYRSYAIHSPDATSPLANGRFSLRDDDDDDYECSNEPEVAAQEKEEKAEASQATVSTTISAVVDADVELQRLTQMYDLRANDARAAMDRAVKAEAAAHYALRVSQAVAEAYTTLTATSTEAQNSAVQLAAAQADEARARAAAAQAFNDFQAAFREEVAAENEVSKIRKEFNDAYEDFLEAVSILDKRMRAAKTQTQKTRTFKWDVYAYEAELARLDDTLGDLAIELSLAKTDDEQRTVHAQIAKVKDRQLKVGRYKQQSTDSLNISILREQQLAADVEQAEEVWQASLDYRTEVGDYYGDIISDYEHAKESTSTQRDRVRSTDAAVEATARASFQAAITAREADRVFEEARRYYEAARNALPGGSDDVAMKKAEADKAFEALMAAQLAAQNALQALNEARAARAKASADVMNSYQRFEDDDDEAGAAAAAAAAFENVNDRAFGDLSTIAYTNAFGSPYLFDDRIDDDLFHNPTITRQGIDRFTTMLKQCSGGSWCNTASPMPVVLVEVVVQNAQMKSIKIPGLPPLSADHLQSAAPVYDRDNAGTLVEVTSPGAGILAPTSYQIDNAPFAGEIQLDGFPKYNHITVPDLNDTTPKEIRMDNWGRVPLVGTGERLTALREQLNQTAKAAGVEPDVYFSLRHISHNFMNVTPHPGQSYIDPVLTYELWSLTINTQYDNAIATLVTPEGPFKASHGFMPASALPKMGDEILMRHTGEQVGPTKQDETFAEEEPIVVYPNPSDGEIHIRFSLRTTARVSCIARDAIGNIVAESETLLHAGAHVKVINLTSQAEGIYLISISTPDYVREQKFVIQKK